MSFFKSTAFIAIFLSLSFSSFAAQKETDFLIANHEYASEMLKTVLYVMQDCYITKHKKDAELSKCMAGVFNKEPNPEQYKIKIKGDTPGNLNLLLYNQDGFTINCALTLNEKIKVNSCFSYQAAPLTKNQKMSITPPEELVK